MKLRSLQIHFLLFTALAGFAFAAPNSQEIDIANRMIGHSGQNRPTLVWDATLAAVARARAVDLATRDYFSHVNPDGHGPNYLVRQAGYPLPDWWGYSATANYIESIAAGRTNADDTWEDWMGSSGHKNHLLAIDDFYQDQTSYGIGYAYSADSTYKHYWVVITAPPRAAPDLVINTPAANARVTTPSITISGSTNNTPVARVEYKLENESEYTPASGTGSWQGTVDDLVPGLNTIQVRSLNSSGGVVSSLTRKVTFVETGELVVNISGNGSVSSGYFPSSMREIGKSYTIAAKPATGYSFAGWTGDIESSSPTLQFVMEKELILQANFVPNPFLNTTGNYVGLIGEANAGEGWINLTINSKGAFSGKFIWKNIVYVLRGVFDIDGVAGVTVTRKNMTPLEVDLSLDFEHGANQFTGTIADGGEIVDLAGNRSVYHAKNNPAALAGNYTAALSPVAETLPLGNGYALINVKSNGRVVIRGKLADGTAYSHATFLSMNETFPWFVQLYKRQGFFSGSVQFADEEASDLTGEFFWSRPEMPTSQFMPEGFSGNGSVMGALFVRPVKGERIIEVSPNNENAKIILEDGGLAGNLEFPVTLTDLNRFESISTEIRKITVNIANGLWRGQFFHPGANKYLLFQGVILRKGDLGAGYFLTPQQSGAVYLESSDIAF